MSSIEEIQEVYLGDIASKSRLVARRKDGGASFLEGADRDGFHTFSVHEGALSDSDKRLFNRIYKQDIESGIEY